MAKTPAEGVFHRRPGVDPFGPEGWKGVNTESDPGSLLPNELLRGDDVRLKGRSLGTRSGCELDIDLNDFTDRADGCGAVLWMHQPGNELRTRLWMSAIGCQDPTQSGFTIYQIDPASDPEIQQYYIKVTAGDRFTPLGKYGDQLYVGDLSLVRVVREIPVPYTITAQELFVKPPLLERLRFDGYTTTCLLEFDGKLFIGLSNDAAPDTSSKIVSWDGGNVVDELTGIRPPLAMGYWREMLLVGFDATAGHIRYREPGAAPGTWTTVALAGFSCTVNQNAFCEVRDKTFIASGVDLLFAFDGTSLSLAQTVVGADTFGDGVNALCMHDGLLHYGWNELGTAAAFIGRHDPDSTGANEWVDNYVGLTDQQPLFTGICSMASYRTQIYAGGRSARVVTTRSGEVAGVVEAVDVASGASSGFRARQLLKFP